MLDILRKNIGKGQVGQLFIPFAGAIGLCFLLLAASCSDDKAQTEPEDTSDTRPVDTNDTHGERGTDTLDKSCVPAQCASPGQCPTSISSLKGTAMLSNGEPLVGTVPVCIPVCVPATSDEQGVFEIVFEQCKSYDFAGGEEPLHMQLALPEGNYATYSVAFSPTQEEVSDQGPTDFEFDLGEHILYAVKHTGVSYSRSAGASVSHEGLSFTLAPGALVEAAWDSETKRVVDTPVDSKTIRVMKAPLDEWTPGFDHVELDALYFVGPFWAKLFEGVSFEVAADPSWSNGDTVEVYFLGEYSSSWGGEADYVYFDEDGACTATPTEHGHIGIGELGLCGTAVVKDEAISTPPLPRLGWIGFKKQ